MQPISPEVRSVTALGFLGCALYVETFRTLLIIDNN